MNKKKLVSSIDGIDMRNLVEVVVMEDGQQDIPEADRAGKVVRYSEEYEECAGNMHSLKFNLDGFYEVRIDFHYSTVDKTYYFTVDSFGDGSQSTICRTREEAVVTAGLTYGAVWPSEEWYKLIDRLLVSQANINAIVG